MVAVVVEEENNKIVVVVVVEENNRDVVGERKSKVGSGSMLGRCEVNVR